MKSYPATAIDCRMVTTFQTPDGREFVLSTALPKGTEVDVYAEALTSTGALIGFDGFEVIKRPVRNKLEDKADYACGFSEFDYAEEVFV
jgi:hypothetical protein